MNQNGINPRMTIIAVFAFLFIVGLFLSPGGPAEETTEQLTQVARNAAARSQAPTNAAPKAWFTAEEQPPIDPSPSPPAVSPDAAPAALAAPADQAAPAAPAGPIPLVEPGPPPQGPDFPENR